MAGWHLGFKATPITGKTMAHTVATGAPHPADHRFSLERSRASSSRARRAQRRWAIEIICCLVNGPRPLLEFVSAGEVRCAPDREHLQ